MTNCKHLSSALGIMLGLFLFLFSVNAQSINQEVWISGKVMNNERTPIAKASIQIKGHKKLGTLSDSLGNFRIALPSGARQLLLSHTSYQPVEIELALKRGKLSSQFIEVILQEDAVHLQQVQVVGTALNTTQTIEQLKLKHQLIAGGTSIAIMKPEVQRLETLKDALKYEPGVVIQELFGANDQPRLSIRGSGIQSNPQRRGVYLLQDGIPVNFADGSFIIGVMDPATAESIEVFKGSNALRYGAATLGGAVNFNSRTGRHHAGVLGKIEGGSYGYMQGNVFLGDYWNELDAFVSVSGSRQDGFRQHNSNQKMQLAANVGYRFSEKIDNRTFFNFSHIQFDIPGPLSLSMLQQNPAQINAGIDLPYYMGPNIKRDLPGRDADVYRIANRTAFRLLPQTDLTVSLYYQYINDRFAFPIVLSTNRSFGNDYGLSLQAVHRMKSAQLTVGFLESHGNIDRRGHINVNGLDSYLFSKDKLNAVNLTFFAEYHHRLSERLHVIGNIQAVNNERNSQDVFANPELRPWYSHTSHKYRYFYSYNTSLDQPFRALNPRLGGIFNAGKEKDIQFFANISGSYEPPTFDELVGTKVTENINTSPKELFAVKLDKQSAYTVEAGTRHEGSNYSWNISAYRSWIKNEILEVKDFVLGQKNTTNYPKSIHQGIEFAGMVAPFKGLLDPKGNDRVSLRAMYTYSDFYFSSGDYQWHNLAGVPPHYLTASLEYNYPSKFFLSLNVESQPQRSPIDHSNTSFQPAFTIFGFRAGVENWKNFSLYIEGKNMLDKYYASSYVISDQIMLPAVPFPSFGVNNLAFYMPGSTRAFYLGLSYKLPAKKKTQSDKQ